MLGLALAVTSAIAAAGFNSPTHAPSAATGGQQRQVATAQGLAPALAARVCDPPFDQDFAGDAHGRNALPHSDNVQEDMLAALRQRFRFSDFYTDGDFGQSRKFYFKDLAGTGPATGYGLVDFAGRFSLFVISCGTGCRVFRVGDVTTGAVYSLRGLGTEDTLYLMMDIRKDSSLILAAWFTYDGLGVCNAAAFRWTGDDLETLFQAPPQKCVMGRSPE